MLQFLVSSKWQIMLVGDITKWINDAEELLRVSLLYSSYDNVATVNMHMMFKLINKQERKYKPKTAFPKMCSKVIQWPQLTGCYGNQNRDILILPLQNGVYMSGQTYIPYTILKFGICMINSGSFTVYFVLFSECPSYPASQYSQLHLTCYVNHIKKSDQFRKWCGKGE